MGGTPILSHFSQILAKKKFISVMTFLIGRFFWAKVPQYCTPGFEPILITIQRCDKEGQGPHHP